MNEIMILSLLFLIGTAHATPISDIDVVQDFPGSIIGGNIYNLTVEYNSDSIFVVYHFQFESPYPLENNTSEIPCVEIYVDGLILNHTRIHKNNTLSVYSNKTLTQSRHNTTVYFTLAHSIFPGNYSFLFEILGMDTQEPIFTYGSGSSRRHNTRTKTCTFKVNTLFEPPENHTEIVIIENITEPTESVPENITENTTLFQGVVDDVNITIPDDVVKEETNYKWIIVVVLFAILVFFGWLFCLN
jgi:hypothetical protein